MQGQRLFNLVLHGGEDVPPRTTDFVRSQSSPPKEKQLKKIEVAPK
jgi:hypothetical protein